MSSSHGQFSPCVLLSQEAMIVQHRAFIRLFLLPSAFSASFRSGGNAAFLSASQRLRLRASARAAHTDTNTHDASNVLVCGDGDLSYSAWLAPQLAEAGVTLTATVLETQDVHNKGAFGEKWK